MAEGYIVGTEDIVKAQNHLFVQVRPLPSAWAWRLNYHYRSWPSRWEVGTSSAFATTVGDESATSQGAISLKVPKVFFKSSDRLSLY